MAFNGTRGSVAAGGEPIPPGKTMSMEQHLVDKGAQMMQSLAPVKQMKQHVCTFALYSHDLTRRIEAHHALCDSHQPGFPSVRCLQFHRPPHRTPIMRNKDIKEVGNWHLWYKDERND
ncbi:hypothetical protein LguiB_004774 [Lonicera macranthoides]